MHDTHDVRESERLDKEEFAIRAAHDREMLIDEGSYWPYNQSFRIQARSWKEAGDKIERMRAIAEERE